jgi:hypothetical protein
MKQLIKSRHAGRHASFTAARCVGQTAPLVDASGRCVSAPN